jgi:YidC/Oxa1 family membrane protein insertase
MFAKWLNSYGWAIIALTVAIRVVLWPLVTSQTKSMQKMSQLQPMMKAMQKRYKDKPEMLQKKMMEFYKTNKVNPFGSCLPMLIQLPILFALYATFSGPPFQAKPIPVKVDIIDASQKEKYKSDQTSQANSPYVALNATQAKIVVHPGETVLPLGKTKDNTDTIDGKSSINFWVTACEGQLPSDFKVNWRISSDPNRASINPEGQASFPKPGKIVLEAIVSKEEGDKQIEQAVIPVTVDVLKDGVKQDGGNWSFGQGEDAFLTKTRLSLQSAQVSVDGKQMKLAIAPGESSIQAGKTARFVVVSADNETTNLPASLKVNWRIASDPNAASIDENGHAVFPEKGQFMIEAVVPGIAEKEPFYFIGSLGKVATGAKLLDPRNLDILSMIVLMGLTMVISQKLMVTTPAADMDPEQAAIQKQTQTMMPITFTIMFCFFPLPAGVLLYFVVSNVIQSLQTWFIMRTPQPALISGLDDNIDHDIDASSNQEKKTSDNDDDENKEDAQAVKVTGNKKKSRKKK